MALNHPFITNPQVANNHRAASPALAHPVPNRVTPDAVQENFLENFPRNPDEDVQNVEPDLAEEERRGYGTKKRKADAQLCRTQQEE